MLFNSLPREIRNITCCKVEAFKTALDRYLRLVPDEPQIPGYTAQRRAESNSLLDMIPHARPSNSLLDTIPHARPQVEAPDDSDERGCVPNIAGVPWYSKTNQVNKYVSSSSSRGLTTLSTQKGKYVSK